MKRVFLLLLAGILSINLMVPAFAASDKATNAADALHALGLFSGTGTDADGNPIYELDRAPTRYEAVTMLVGLLGKKQEALTPPSRMWQTGPSPLWAMPTPTA